VKSWIEVSEERLQANYRLVSERAGVGTTVMAVVKANAYGHGDDRCAVALARAGAMWFGVADVHEGAAVRCALDAAEFVRAEILVLCGLLPEDVAGLVQNRLTPVVWTVEQVRALRGQRGLKVHVELETGMGRQGCRPGAEFDAVLDAIEAAGLSLGGVMTHFCAAEVVGSEKTGQQQAEFATGVGQVRDRGLRPEWVHAGSSSSLDDPTWRGEWLRGVTATAHAKAMMRCGIGLYGYCNPLDGGESVLRPKLLPVMTWKTCVLDVREMRAGECIGYNSLFVAQVPMRLALLPVGYADGVRRSLSSTNACDGGWVMVRGERAPIIGRVSMNLTMVDVSGIEGVAVGDQVVLLGDGVTADDHARLAGTISYEILCGVRTESTSCQ
jgi:alanine racemase